MNVFAGAAPLLPCVPPAWARSGHAQTIFGHIMGSPRLKHPAEPFELPLGDGDQLALDHIPGPGRLVVSVFHGLGGSTEAKYMLRTANLCADLGLPVVLANHRGAGRGQGLARRPYHSGSAEDLSAVLKWSRARYPDRAQLAIGFSLSANALLLLLSGSRGDTLPDYAIAVNAPINLETTSRRLGRGFNRLYDVRFLRECRARIPRPHDYRVPLHSTLRDFDELYTAPASGFRDRADYYAQCSTYARLSEIRTPTALVMSEDDPMIDSRDYKDARRSAAVHLHLERVGGHMGYLTRDKTPLGTHRWLDYALWHFVRLAREAAGG